ncbi:hypothetical protein [Arthrobacter sp. 260]|uniref:hypothetical protein n=1 Tax=Arthrobacter sp. 260 TaxID=2735314 RepID=UPI001E2C2094|nr:hypothetical protein [Arthrobacter sp. 260]
MRRTLRNWIADADTRKNVELFKLQSQIMGLSYQDGRGFDLYLALVGEMFDLLRDPPEDTRDWATLANAFTQAGGQFDGAARRDAFFMAAAAFYTGGFSASAYVAMRQVPSDGWPTDAHRACYDFLARLYRLTSERVTSLVGALATGDLDSIAQAMTSAAETATRALQIGPEEWVAEKVFSSLVDRFSRTNLRAVLPDGGSQRWDPLIESLIGRTRPVWDFFPSQVTAIEAGLLTGTEPFSMQMPTGAGKTALTETLLFDHLTDRPDELCCFARSLPCLGAGAPRLHRFTAHPSRTADPHRLRRNGSDIRRSSRAGRSTSNHRDTRSLHRPSRQCARASVANLPSRLR